MTINVAKKEFHNKWCISGNVNDTTTYTDGVLYGTIQYENDDYIVVKLVN